VAPENAFDVDVRRDGDRMVVAPSGELDIATVDQLRAVLGDREPGQDLELDLRRLSFVDTSGLQLLVELHRRSASETFRLRIVRGSTNVQRVFEIAGLERVLPFVEGDGA
jgi:anti-sigma B factor antagonist